MSQAPLGTHFEDGLRVGPYPRENQNINLTTSQVQPRQSQNYTMNGPGILMSSSATYAFTPKLSAPTDVTGILTAANIGNAVLTGNIGAAVRFTLAGSNPGQNALQLDYPRTVAVRGANATATDGAIEVKIYGWDFYGVPLTETIVAPAGTVTNDLIYGRKAFYVITGVRLSLATVTPWTVGEISVETRSSFGLPYRLFSTADVLQIGTSKPAYNNNEYEGTFDLGVVPVALAAPAPLAIMGTIGVPPVTPATSGGFVASQAVPFPIATSRDVRGIYTPTTALIAADTTYMFTYYVRGADQSWMQEFYRRQDNQALPPVYPPTAITPAIPGNPFQALIPYDTTVAADSLQTPLPFNTNDIYGYRQYYEVQPV